MPMKSSGGSGVYPKRPLDDSDTLASWPFDVTYTATTEPSTVNTGAATLLTRFDPVVQGIYNMPWTHGGISPSGLGRYYGAATVRPTGTPFSISFWYINILNAGQRYLISKFYSLESWVSPYTSFTIFDDGGVLRYLYCIGGVYTVGTFGYAPPILQLNMLVVTLDGSNIRLYCNSELVTTIALVGAIDWNNDSGKWWIGNGVNGAQSASPNTLFDVRIHNVARDAAWCLQQYNTSMGFVTP